jgi:hypothetical protein
MRLHITVSFDEEHPFASSRRPWPELVEELRQRILDDPAGYLDSGEPKRSNLHVVVRVE